jgi:hypothetical protein
VKIALNAFFLSAWAILLPSVLSCYVRGLNLTLSYVRTLFDDAGPTVVTLSMTRTRYLDRDAGPSGMKSFLFLQWRSRPYRALASSL